MEIAKKPKSRKTNFSQLNEEFQGAVTKIRKRILWQH